MTRVLGSTSSAECRVLEEPNRFEEELGILGRVRASEKMQVNLLFHWSSPPQTSDLGVYLVIPWVFIIPRLKGIRKPLECLAFAPLNIDLFYKFSLFFKKIFIYFWLCWVFVAVRGLSLVASSGGYSSLW